MSEETNPMKQSIKMRDLTRDKMSLKINTEMTHQPRDMLTDNIGCTPLAHSQMNHNQNLINQAMLNSPKRLSSLRSNQRPTRKTKTQYSKYNTKQSGMEYGYNNVFLDDSINQMKIVGMQKNKNSQGLYSDSEESQNSKEAFRSDMILNRRTRMDRSQESSGVYGLSKKKTNPRLKRKNRERRKGIKNLKQMEGSSRRGRNWNKTKTYNKKLHANRNEEDEKIQKTIEDLFADNRNVNENELSLKDKLSNCMCKAF